MNRVLVVVSCYAPALNASVHRARTMAWCLRDLGWDCEILSPSPEFFDPCWVDPDSGGLFAAPVVAHAARPAVGDWLLRRLGLRSSAWRGLIPLCRTGLRLLKSGRFDLAYFSTTNFTFFCLGRFWLRRCGVPYVLDFQDPWYRPARGRATTKHWIKYWIGAKLARYMEAFAVKGAHALVSVSPNYLADLRARYPRADVFASGRSAVIPFGVLPSDLEIGRQLAFPDSKDPCCRTIVYVGVGHHIMRRSFRRLADGIARLRRGHPAIVECCRIRLYGTQGGWQPGERKVLFDEAVAAGIGDLVEEDPRIVSYSVATSLAVAADGLLVLGVEDPAYMPSKLFPYAATGRPLLACLNRDSQASSYFKRFPNLGTLIHFGRPAETETDEDGKLLGFLEDVVGRRQFDRANVLAEHSAMAMTRRHVELFERCLK